MSSGSAKNTAGTFLCRDAWNKAAVAPELIPSEQMYMLTAVCKQSKLLCGENALTKQPCTMTVWKSVDKLDCSIHIHHLLTPRLFAQYLARLLPLSMFA